MIFMATYLTLISSTGHALLTYLSKAGGGNTLNFEILYF